MLKQFTSIQAQETVDPKLVRVGYLSHLIHSPKAGGENILEDLSCGISTEYFGLPEGGTLCRI